MCVCVCVSLYYREKGGSTWRSCRECLGSQGNDCQGLWRQKAAHESIPHHDWILVLQHLLRSSVWTVLILLPSLVKTIDWNIEVAFQPEVINVMAQQVVLDLRNIKIKIYGSYYSHRHSVWHLHFAAQVVLLHA